MHLSKKTRLLAAAALLAGLLLRIFFAMHHPRWGGDTLVYGDLAENMLRHHVFGFSEETIRPTLIRLPGYPIFLAACFVLFGHANYLAVCCVQIALDLLGCILLALLASRICNPRAGMATLWLAALCPFTANYSAAALTETTSIFCVTLALFALERWASRFRTIRDTISSNLISDDTITGAPYLAAPSPDVGSQNISLLWPLIIGLSLSFAVLIRPDQGLLAAAIIPAMLWLAFTTPHRSFTKRIGPAAIASLVVVLPLLLWGARNYRVFHIFQPLAPRYANDPGELVDFGFQRWYRTWGIDFKSTYDVYWTWDGSPIDMATLPPRAFDTPAQRQETAALIARYNVEQSASPAFDAAFAQLAAQRVAAHPLRYYLAMPSARLANMWLRPRTELFASPMDWWNFAAHPTASTLEFLFALLNAAYLALGIIGFICWRKTLWLTHSEFLIAALGFTGLRCLLLLTLDNSEPRYVLECFPVVILFAGSVFAASRFHTALSFRSEAEGSVFGTTSTPAASDSRQSYSCPS